MFTHQLTTVGETYQADHCKNHGKLPFFSRKISVFSLFLWLVAIIYPTLMAVLIFIVADIIT